MSLSDSYLRSVVGKERENTLVKADRDGLSIRVSPKGKAVFQYRYRFGGKQKRVDLGSYPAMALKDARNEALRLKGILETGRDPAQVRVTERLAQDSASTVEDVIREWGRLYAIKEIKNSEALIRTFELHVFPVIGKLKHDDATLHTWLKVIEHIAESKESIAKRILTFGKQAHRWALRRQMVATTPLSEITARDLGLKSKVTKRVLDDDEIRLLFEAIAHTRMSPKNGIFIKLSLLFACRSGELAGAKVSDFDFEKNIWRIPPEKHKTGKKGKEIVRPIIPAAKEMLEEAMRLNRSSEFIFIKDGVEVLPMTSHAVLSLPERVMRYAAKKKGILIPHWSMHDLRRTARTRLAELAPPHICEIMLGHSLPGVWAVYDHSNYLEEQRKAYSLWWAMVESIVYGEGKVSLLVTG